MDRAERIQALIPGEDRITFRAWTRFGTKAATRVVTGFYTAHDNVREVTVRHSGWGEFIVHDHEITHINGEELD